MQQVISPKSLEQPQKQIVEGITIKNLKLKNYDLKAPVKMIF